MPVKKTKLLEVKTYSLGITIKKLLIEAATVGAISALIYVADVGIPELAIDNQQYALIIMASAAFVRGIANWLMHKGDIEEILIDAKTNEVIR